MSQTEQNLKEAFAGESQANRKYLAFAKKADKEGYKHAAKLFRAAAAAETIHAHAHFDALNGVGSTEENLREAIGGETHEFQSMYPPMIEDAVADGEKKAERSFRLANEVEKIHAELYTKALDNLEKSEDVAIHVCSVCGYTVEGDAPDECPVCKAKKQAFFEVE